MINNLLRKLIHEMCKRDEYWGRGGAGVMFTCSDDDTVLLLLRAEWVDQPGTWGIPGGGVEEGWFETPIEDPITDMSIFIGAAMKEATEECGSLPPDFAPNEQIVGKTAYEDCGFQYITFIVDITADQKAEWNISLDDGESADFVWAPLVQVRAGSRIKGKPLHFGVEYTISRI